MTDTASVVRSVRPIPEGYHSLTPALVVDNAAEAIEFYKRVFGAHELFRMAAPDGKKVWHAELLIGNSHLMLGDEAPDVYRLLLNTACRYDAWDFVRAHWDEMIRKFPDAALPRMCEAIVALGDRDKEVHEFFQAHRVRLGGKIIDQHLERLRIAVAFRNREGAAISASLKG